MRPSEIAEALRAILPTKQPVFLKGSPGIGKTSLMFQAAAAIYNGGSNLSTVGGLPEYPWFVPISATDKDPVDLKGLPYVKDGHTYWSVPEIISALHPDGGVICIEELPQATSAVQCVLRELLLDRSIGRKRIPDTWTVCATGNRKEDRAGAGRLLSHVASAVVNLDLEVSNDDWQTWALAAGISPSVRSFLRFRPGLLHKFDATKDQNTDPRGWERVSILENAIPESLAFNVYRGCVDEGPTAEFIAFRRLFTQLPDVDQLLAKASDYTVPSDPAVLYALVGAIVERARKADVKTLTAVATYAGRMAAEFATLLMRDTMAVAPKFSQIPETARWCKVNSALFTS